MTLRKKLITAAMAAALVGAAPLLGAQEKKPEPPNLTEQSQPYRPGGGHGHGHGMGGMMGGPGYGPGHVMGPGMMGGHGHGWGMGHGRMGDGHGHDCGMGHGTMGGHGHGSGMGHGMMGGRGFGPGMMGPGMMGPGMMGFGTMGPGMPGPSMMMGRMGAIWGLDLSDEQAGRLDKIHDELHRKHRGLMSQMWEAQDRLRDAYRADSRDPAAVGKAFAQVSDVQRQMLESHVQAEKQMEEALTQEQREQLRRELRRSERFNRFWR